MDTKILLVEDDATIGSIIKETLVKQGYIVEWLKDGTNAIVVFNKFEPAICLLDIMLPSSSGIEIAKNIRTLNASIPIIFLTAKSQTNDVIDGFKAGANDYIKKPFSLEELIVRIETLLKFNTQVRVKNNNETDFYFGKTNFSYIKQILVTPKNQYTLTFKENEILKLLLINKDYVIARNDLLKAVWGSNTFFNSRILDVYVARLRNYLKDDSSLEILTIRGIGFKLTDK